jgi:Tripartite ATP-independent periplasmic transporter, DctM component
MSAALIFGLLFALMLTGMPISISLGLTVLTFLFTMTEVPIESVGLKLFSGLDNFGIMAIPFFILAGTFLTRGGVARRMIAFTTSLVGHLPGGLGLAGVAACAMFAAISGSSVATVVAIGAIMLPAMVQYGYPRRFGVGVISTSGALGILVPPSIILVLYGVSTNTSIGALFMAGIVPGILLALMLAAVTFFVARRNHYPRMKRASFADQFKAFCDSIWGLLLIGIVLGGIYGGIFTPTEAAAVAATEGSAAGGEHELDAALYHHQCGAVLVPDDARADPASDGGVDHRQELFDLDVFAGRQRDPAARRQCDGSLVDPADHGADPVSAGDKTRRPSRPSRRVDDRQYRGRVVPSAGRAQSLHRLEHCEDGDQRNHHRRAAVAGRDARVPRPDHLRPGDFAVAAAAARNDLDQFSRRKRRITSLLGKAYFQVVS